MPKKRDRKTGQYKPKTPPPPPILGINPSDLKNLLDPEKYEAYIFSQLYTNPRAMFSTIPKIAKDILDAKKAASDAAKKTIEVTGTLQKLSNAELVALALTGKKEPPANLLADAYPSASSSEPSPPA